MARVWPRSVGLPVNAGLLSVALVFSCNCILEDTVLRYEISVGVAPENVLLLRVNVIDPVSVCSPLSFIHLENSALTPPPKTTLLNRE